jgi:hypothetical protein
MGQTEGESEANHFSGRSAENRGGAACEVVKSQARKEGCLMKR